MLKYKVYRPFVRGDADHAFAANLDVAIRWFRKAGNHAQQGSFAAARWAENRKELAIRDFKRYVVYRNKIFKLFGYMLNR